MQGAQVFERERVLLDGDEVQALRAPGIRAPGAPRLQEIKPEAESGLEDDEALAAGPALGEAVAAKEHVAGLLEAAFRAVVDVAERLGPGRAVAKSEPCRDESGRHALLFNIHDPGANHESPSSRSAAC